MNWSRNPRAWASKRHASSVDRGTDLGKHTGFDEALGLLRSPAIVSTYSFGLYPLLAISTLRLSRSGMINLHVTVTSARSDFKSSEEPLQKFGSCTELLQASSKKYSEIVFTELGALNTSQEALTATSPGIPNPLEYDERGAPGK